MNSTRCRAVHLAVNSAVDLVLAQPLAEKCNADITGHRSRERQRALKHHRHRSPITADATRLGAQEPGEGEKKSGLASTIRSNDGRCLAATQLEKVDGKLEAPSGGRPRDDQIASHERD